MKHYMDPGSGSCRRVSAVAQHLGIELDEVLVDLLKGENRQPDFLALSPSGMVPALVDGDTVLTESAAIMIYLAEQVEETELWPKGPARYDVLRWMFWAAEHFRQGPPIYVEEKIVAKLMGLEPDEARIVEANRRIERYGTVLDAHLKDRDFVVGDSWTLADIDLAAPLSHMARAGMPFESYPSIFYRMMLINIDISCDLDRQIKKAMLRKRCQHM